MASWAGAPEAANYPAHFASGQQEQQQQGTDNRRFDKTKICKFFAKGQCKRGHACTFAHGTHELKAQPDLFKTQLCFDFVASGRCRAGTACRFAHSPDEVRSAEADEAAAAALLAPSVLEPTSMMHVVCSQIEMMQQQVVMLQGQLQWLQLTDGEDWGAVAALAGEEGSFCSQSTELGEGSAPGSGEALADRDEREGAPRGVAVGALMGAQSAFGAGAPAFVDAMGCAPDLAERSPPLGGDPLRVVQGDARS